MNFKKTGFTLIEIIIVFTIIGVITVFELIILQNRMNQYGAPYYNIYSALKKASYNILADMYCPNSNSDDPECRKGPRPFPDNSYDMCRRLAEFINVPKGATCGTDKNDTTKDINNDATNINDSTLRFVSSNAARFYISPLKTYTFDSGETLNYFIVYVDINGKESPNKVDKEQQEKVYPDIVPFAITTRGETIPMGYPIYSNMYLTAKIGYPAAEINGAIVDNRFSKTMSFFEAIQGAWGGAISPDIPFSIPFTEELPDTNLAKSFFLGQVPESAEFKSQEGCKGGEYTCRVVIDSYMDKRF